MVEEKLRCSSCNRRITNDAGRSVFKCPQCGEDTVIRCSVCRQMAVKYKCKKCGFTGPN